MDHSQGPLLKGEGHSSHSGLAFLEDDQCNGLDHEITGMLRPEREDDRAWTVAVLHTGLWYTMRDGPW